LQRLNLAWTFRRGVSTATVAQWLPW